MFAVVEVGGHQHIVSVGDIIEVDRQSDAETSKTSFSPLLVSDASGESVQIGTPFVEGRTVSCRIVDHFLDAKTIVYKMKSKKHYHRTQGFRARKTRLEVVSIA